MSLRALINFGESGSIGIGINFRYEKNIAVSISYVVLQRENTTLKVLKKDAAVASVAGLEAALETYLQQEVRIHVNFEGSNILTKQSNSPDVTSLFPGLNKNDFFSQTYIGDSCSFVGILRKEMLQSNEFVKRHVQSIVSYSFGVFITASLLPLVKSTSLVVSGFRLTIRNSVFSLMEPTSDVESLVVGDESLSPDEILAYASCLAIFLPVESITSTTAEITQEAKGRYAVKKRSFSFMRVLLILLLGIMLVNTLLYFSLRDKVATMEEEVSFRKNLSSQDDNTKSIAGKLLARFESAGWTSNDMPLLYSDQLALSLPAELELTRLEIGRFDELLYRKEKRQNFFSKQGFVKGYAQNPSQVTSWIAVLERFPWVDRVEGQQYQHDARTGRGIFEFVITLK